jgi:glycosyltransferase involved in cell wall biosynthesis
MKVLMVCRKYSGIRHDHWAPAGTPAVIKLIEELEARAHPTTVLFLAKSSDASSGDSVTDYGIFRNVRFIHVGWRGAHRLPAALSDLVNDTRQFFRVLRYVVSGFDIRYFDRAHLGYAALFSLLFRNVVWRCLGVQSFLIARDSGKGMGALYLALARTLVRFPIRLMICTNDGSPWFRLFRGRARRRLLLLTNGVDFAKRAIDTPNTLPVIGFVGRATLAKGLDIFVDICANLAERGASFRAVAIGGGQYLNEARLKAQQLGVGGIVDFAGSIPHSDICSRFANIDIYCATARNGIFSNTTLEALAAGCCVVALSPNVETGADVTTAKFLQSDLIAWIARNEPVKGCAEVIARWLVDPVDLSRRRTLTHEFAAKALVPWNERIRREADLMEQLAGGQVPPRGALAGDLFALRAFEEAA